MGSESGNIAVPGKDLLEAQAHIWNHIFSFINSMALKCAVQLEIPDVIHRHGRNPIPLSKLVSDLQLHPHKTQCVHRLMRLLVLSGFFTLQKLNQNDSKEEEEGYLLTDSSRLLLKHNPATLTPFVLAMLDPFLVEPWQFLSTWFRNDNGTPFQLAHGMEVWEYLGSKPKESCIFNEAMASDARLVMSVLLDKYKCLFDGVESFVDVGGSTGAAAKAIADAFPQIQCTVLDLPHVVADLNGNENLKFLGGDMFEAIPPADALLLKWILHDWSDEECLKILKKCKEAVTSKGKSGKVIVIEMVIEDKKEDKNSNETQLFFDILMMTTILGKERDEKEWGRLFHDAGFSNFKIFPILGLRSLIEIYP